ncbi:MAG: secretion protein F, partial [Clostridia bacterium]|nr:secretion protein F [Clostridia bacterium]
MIGAIVGALVGIGVFFIYLDMKKIPYLKTSQAIDSIYKKQKNKTSVIEVWLQGLSDFFSRHIRINEFRREALAEQLKAAQIDKTPEQYKSDAIVKALMIMLIAMLGGIFIRILIPFAVILGIVLYNMEMKKAEKQIKRKQEEIEFELPRLVFTISRTMKHDRDLIHILEGYKNHAGPFMKHELEITIADMKSLSQKVAIHRLDTRLCSQMVSDVCRGLEAMERGD